MATGKSGISEAAGVAAVDGGEEVDGDEEFPREGSDAGKSGSVVIGGVDVAGIAEVSGLAESVGVETRSASLSGSAICGVGAVLSELLPQLVASSTMAVSRLAKRMRFFEAGSVI